MKTHVRVVWGLYGKGVTARRAPCSWEIRSYRIRDGRVTGRPVSSHVSRHHSPHTHLHLRENSIADETCERSRLIKEHSSHFHRGHTSHTRYFPVSVSSVCSYCWPGCTRDNEVRAQTTGCTLRSPQTRCTGGVAVGHVPRNQQGERLRTCGQALGNT